MGKMAEYHDSLSMIHTIIRDHRVNCLKNIRACRAAEDTLSRKQWELKLEAIDDLIVEIEAQGIEFPEEASNDPKCSCEGDLHPECGPWG